MRTGIHTGPLRSNAGRTYRTLNIRKLTIAGGLLLVGAAAILATAWSFGIISPFKAGGGPAGEASTQWRGVASVAPSGSRAADVSGPDQPAHAGPAQSLSSPPGGLTPTIATGAHEALLPRHDLQARSDLAQPGALAPSQVAVAASGGQMGEVQAPGAVAANQYRSGQAPGSTELSAASRQWLLSHAVEAEEVSSDLNTDQVEETAVRVASSEPNNSASSNAIAGLTAMFYREPDPGRKQDLLAAAQDLASNAPVNILPLLQAALQPAQPVDVQRQALYMAADIAPDLVQAVAANPSSPLQQDAQAFLLNAQSP